MLEFSSERKRMSVIVRDMQGKLVLLCKGAPKFHFFHRIEYTVRAVIYVAVIYVVNIIRSTYEKYYYSKTPCLE